MGCRPISRLPLGGGRWRRGRARQRQRLAHPLVALLGVGAGPNAHKLSILENRQGGKKRLNLAYERQRKTT